MKPDWMTVTPTPGELLGWLRSVGWRRTGNNARWAQMTREVDGQQITLDVPLLGQARDYAGSAAVLIADVAEMEGRAPQAVLLDVRSVSLDVVRLALIGASTEAGRLSVAACVDTIRGARDLLLAAASSALGARAAYLGRRHASAMSFLGEAKLVRVEQGSFVLCIEVPVPPQLQDEPLDESAPEPEYARRVTRRLAEGMAGVEAALRESELTDSLDPFVSRATQGVSANLCEALALMLDASQVERIEASVGFAARRPVAVETPRRGVVARTHLPLLREAARGLRGKVAETDVVVSGPVVKLASGDPVQGGRVVLQAEVDERLRFVQMDLGTGDYAVAVEAHKQCQFVEVTGALRRRGNVWLLEPAGPLRGVAVPEGDPD